MAAKDYGRYIITKPLYDGTGFERTQRRIPPMTFISNQQIPGVNNVLEVGWVSGIEPSPRVYEHTHKFDEIIIHWGTDPEAPQELGGEIEFYIGGQPVTVNTTTAFFIPKGVRHGPVTSKNIRRPHLQMTLTLGTGEIADARRGLIVPRRELPRKSDKFDYEQCVVRSPLRETGGIFKRGRQAPTMTYMSRLQVNKANCYIEFGWIWDEVEPSIGEMRHKEHDEIVLHMGSDPVHPEDLGGEMVMGMNGKLFTLNNSYAAFIPRGVRHGPNIFKGGVRKPYIEMAIMLGAGTYAEGWADSFFEKPAGR